MAEQFTRTHQAFFATFVEKLFRQALQSASPDTDVDHIISMIDFREYGKRFGEEAFKHASYTDLKYADKVLADERVIRATQAMEHAIAKVAPTTDELKSVEVAAQFLMSGVLPQEHLMDAIADSGDAVQHRVFQLALERKD
jgi:hypothetical protein